MDLNTPENREFLIGHFNGLGNDTSFYVHSPQNRGYNCIAWAMGFDDRWVDYILNSPKKWWPQGVTTDFKPSSLVSAFESMGFEVCDDDSIEQDYDKVALYKTGPFKNPLTGTLETEGWTHAARVIAPGVYHSKIGESFDIYHGSGDVFVGSSYGSVYRFMKRPIRKRDIVDRIKQEEPVKIVLPPNLDNLIKSFLSGK